MIDSELPPAREEGWQRAPRFGATATSTKEATCAPTSTPLSRQFMCWWTTSCPSAKGPGAPARISDAELITLAIAQVFLGLPNDRRFLALARYRLGFP
jgi:hypothetical protein